MGFELTEPSKEMAEQVLREIETFDERLEVHKSTANAGNSVLYIYNLEDLVDSLVVSSREDLASRSSRAAIVFVPPEELLDWLGEKLGDKELQLAVAQAIELAEYPNDLIRRVKEVLEYRLRQCQAVLYVEDESEIAG
ncbi:MAG: hypothetical protein ACYC1U_01225 [Candidatus Aquicultorales bacterium]